VVKETCSRIHRSLIEKGWSPIKGVKKEMLRNLKKGGKSSEGVKKKKKTFGPKNKGRQPRRRGSKLKAKKALFPPQKEV